MKTETAAKERPILFLGEMVRAILDGRKTQTRRIVKPQPDHCTTGVIDWKKIRASNEHSLAAAMASAFPYGQPGDRLWVRETWDWRARQQGDFTIQDFIRNGGEVRYRADNVEKFDRWNPSIHMPRRASRITLEITAIRAERLQDISEEAAKAEGAQMEWTPEEDDRWMASSEELAAGYQPPKNYVSGFENVWRSINGKTSWAANPWVWVIEFKPI